MDVNWGASGMVEPDAVVGRKSFYGEAYVRQGLAFTPECEYVTVRELYSYDIKVAAICLDLDDGPTVIVGSFELFSAMTGRLFRCFARRNADGIVYGIKDVRKVWGNGAGMLGGGLIDACIWSAAFADSKGYCFWPRHADLAKLRKVGYHRNHNTPQWEMINMPTTTTSIIDMLKTTAPNIQVIGDLNGIERALTLFEQSDGVKPETVAAKLAAMADATHIWADDNGHNTLVLFRDADGGTYTDGDPFDWHDAHTIRNLISPDDSPEKNRMRCPICHNHIHHGSIDSFYCEYEYHGWNHGRLCHQYVHHYCARSYRGDSYACYCPEHWHEDNYRGPYDGKPWYGSAFTFGLELEVDGTLKKDAHDTLRTSPLVAGYCRDGSLRGAGLEYHTHPLTMTDIDALTDIVSGISSDIRQRRSGGHMHVRRTKLQTAPRWYWALRAFTENDAMRKLAWEQLNMRHVLESREHDNASESSYWCPLIHGDYSGKRTAVNGCHALTIELRTFGRWDCDTAPRLANAVRWAHHMWRYFQHNPLHSLDSMAIMAESERYALQLTRKPMWMMKGEERRRLLEERRAEREAERRERIRCMREHVLGNIKADKRARRGHWKRYRRIAERERNARLKAKRERRALIQARLDDRYCGGTVYSFSPVSRLDVYHAIIDGKLSVYGGIVRVVNPATKTVIQHVTVSCETGALLTNRHRRVRTISRAIRNPLPNVYKPGQVMRIYRRIAQNHGIDLEPSNLGNQAVRFKRRNTIITNFM